MTDIRESTIMDENEIKSILSDNEKLESINPESTRLKSTVNPTRPKERASAATKQSEERKRESENKGRQNIKQKEVALTGISKQLDKQSTQINKIIQILQPAQKQFKSVERQSELIKQIQSQLKQLQTMVLQVQKRISITKNENMKNNKKRF